MGVAFLLVSIVLSRSGMGQGWWFWMLLPAFGLMGTGIAQYIRIQERQKQASLVSPPVTRTFQEHSRNPDELMPPAPSVTEGTTRHLGVEAPTRHFDPTKTSDSKTFPQRRKVMTFGFRRSSFASLRLCGRNSFQGDQRTN